MTPSRAAVNGRMWADAVQGGVRVVFCGTGWLPVVDAIRERLAGLGLADARVEAADRSRPLAPQLAECEVVLPSNAPFQRELILGMPRLRLIQQPAVGHEGIDLAAARERGVPVCNAPGGSHDAVAQAALLLMLALARRLRGAQRGFAAARIGVPLGVELGGRTLGLIGRGNTGSRLARLADALGMRVLSVGASSSRRELEALLAAADFVSIHCPLSERTRGLLGAAELALMRRGAFLINCARGAIVDRAALEAALASGQLGGAGLDVYWDEPWDPAEPLFQRDDVIALPHVAGSTEEAFGRIAAIVAGNIRRLVDGHALEHRIA